MAITLRLYNNSTQVGDNLVLGDNVVSRVSTVLNQGSNAANANLFLKICLNAGVQAIRERGAKAQVKTSEEALATAIAAYYAAYDGDAPVIPE